jgi:hypothetical protein
VGINCKGIHQCGAAHGNGHSHDTHGHHRNNCSNVNCCNYY